MQRAIALSGIGIISFSAIFVRLAGTSPITTAFFRALYAIPVLAVIWLWGKRRDQRPGRVRLLAAAAGLFLAADLLAWHNAIDDIGAGLATVLANVQVVFVAVIAWVVYRERPSTLAIWLVPNILIGVTLISGLGRSDAYGASPLRGVAFGLAAGVLYAGFILTLRAANRMYLAPTGGPMLDATLGLLIGTVVLAPFSGGIDVSWTWPAHGWLIAIGVLAQAIGWLLITYTLPRLPALETSLLILLQPVLTVVWARIIFEERLSTVQLTGVVLVLAGLGILSGRSVQQEPAPALGRS